MLEKTREGTKKLDPRVRRTRQWLVEALNVLMSEKSFQAITVRDITERAQVNRVTFYAHFEDKEALLEYSIREMFRKTLRAQLPEGAPFSSDNLAQLVRTVCVFLTEVTGHCPPPHRHLEPLMEKQIKAALYEVLLAWRAAMPAPGTTGPTTPELAAMVTSWAIYGAAVQWSQQAQRAQVEQFAREVVGLILPSFQPLPA